MQGIATLSIPASGSTEQARTQYLQRPDGAIAYTDYGGSGGSGGSGEPVLMLPGMGALRSEYRFLAPVLRDAGFRPVAMDLRGQGDSSVPWPTYAVPAVGDDLLALVDHLNAGPAHVIATSFSPAPALWAAAEHPGKIRSLVLISAFARDVRPNPFVRAMFWLMLNNPWRVRTWTMYYRMFYPTRKPADFDAYLAQVAANFSQPGRFEAVKGFSAAPREDWVSRQDQVRAPVLVVMGSKDPDFSDPQAEGQYLAQATRGRLVMIAGAGHYPQTEMPEQTAPAILEFLRQA